MIQPFLLVFVFLYVFPLIGQGVGGGGRSASQSDFATVLVPGVVAVSIMFQGIQSVALPMATEFGFTREIEDRVFDSCGIVVVALTVCCLSRVLPERHRSSLYIHTDSQRMGLDEENDVCV